MAKTDTVLWKAGDSDDVVGREETIFGGFLVEQHNIDGRGRREARAKIKQIT